MIKLEQIRNSVQVFNPTSNTISKWSLVNVTVDNSTLIMTLANANPLLGSLIPATHILLADCPTSMTKPCTNFSKLDSQSGTMPFLMGQLYLGDNGQVSQTPSVLKQTIGFCTGQDQVMFDIQEPTSALINGEPYFFDGTQFMSGSPQLVYFYGTKPQSSAFSPFTDKRFISPYFIPNKAKLAKLALVVSNNSTSTIDIINNGSIIYSLACNMPMTSSPNIILPSNSNLFIKFNSGNSLESFNLQLYIHNVL